MTSEQAKLVLEMLQKGKVLMIGEWRGFKAETIRYNDKKTGKPAEFSRIVHTVEVGDGQRFESVKVSAPLPDGTDVERVQVNIKRGQQVLVAVSGYEVALGNTTARTDSIQAL